MRRQQLGSTQPGAPTGVIVASNRLCWDLLPLQTLIWAHFITVYFHKGYQATIHGLIQRFLRSSPI